MKKFFLAKSLAFIGANTGGAKSALGMHNLLNADDLEASANGLSNYTGGGRMNYTGAGDDMLNFDGNYGSFADPIHRGKLYTIILTNANANMRTALLCPGLLRNAVGLIQDGAFNDTTGAAGLSASGTPMAIAYFNAFIDKFPTLCAAFKVSTSNISQFDMDITIYKESPFKQYESRIINIAAWASEANPNTTLISVQESFYMDQETHIEYPVLGNTIVSLGLFFGVSLNIANALRVKTEKAKETLSQPGAMQNYRGRY